MDSTATGPVAEAAAQLQSIREEVERVIIGQRALIEGLIRGLLCNGHILIEGIPGLAKTLAVSTLAQTLDARFHRIQFTPDLLPGDLIGTMVYSPKSGDFYCHKGPIFCNILLADEINRAPAKVQSALLEAMQERQVSIGDESHALEAPFLVLATQNPIEQEGTYQLPEAQMDRFMFKLKVDYPSLGEEHVIMKRMARTEPELAVDTVIGIPRLMEIRRMVDGIAIKECLELYILHLVAATRRPQDYDLDLAHYIRHGASPRASIYLAVAARGHALMQGRDYVVPDDIKLVGYDVLRHRVALTYRAEADKTTSEDILKAVFDRIEVP